jgi:hypothetical protein
MTESAPVSTVSPDVSPVESSTAAKPLSVAMTFLAGLKAGAVGEWQHTPNQWMPAFPLA